MLLEMHEVAQNVEAGRFGLFRVGLLRTTPPNDWGRGGVCTFRFRVFTVIFLKELGFQDPERLLEGILLTDIIYFHSFSHFQDVVLSVLEQQL
jgi:hypothetical protein